MPVRGLTQRLVFGALAGAIVLGGGCRRSTEGGNAAGSPTAGPGGGASVSVALGKGRRAEDAAQTHQKIDIPAGSFYAGSLPGDEGRDPTLEPLATAYEVPAFSIDALPYPNDPTVAPFTGLTPAEAEKKCAERSERLCSELEWERACRGPAGDAFSAGPSWDPSCTETPDKCISGFGVRMIGSSLQEWTSSTLAIEGKGTKGIVKGAWASAAPAAHRCAARHIADGHSASKMIGFRCCSGTGATGVKMPEITAVPTYRKGAMTASRLAEIFAETPELARIRSMPRFFKDTELAPIFDKSKGQPSGWNLTTEPILWSPEPGEELLVLTGRSKGGAFVLALHVLPGDKYRLASSLVFANEQGPIVLAYQGNLKKEILWSMCWGCAGEGGAITYRDDHRVVIVQR